MTKNNYIVVVFLIILWFSIANMFIIGEINHIYLLNNVDSSKDSNFLQANELFVNTLHSWYFNFFVYLFGFVLFINVVLMLKDKLSILKINLIFFIQYLIVFSLTIITLLLSYTPGIKWNFTNVLISFIIFLFLTNILYLILRKKK